jgi:hypothetical protein
MTSLERPTGAGPRARPHRRCTPKPGEWRAPSQFPHFATGQRMCGRWHGVEGRTEPESWPLLLSLDVSDPSSSQAGRSLCRVALTGKRGLQPHRQRARGRSRVLVDSVARKRTPGELSRRARGRAPRGRRRQPARRGRGGGAPAVGRAAGAGRRAARRASGPRARTRGRGGRRPHLG